jgi:cell shape-determining protein MreD
MVGGLLFTPGGGAVAGFFSGALAGWMSGGMLAVSAATRAIVAFGLGFAQGPELKLNGWAALALVAVGTLVARLLAMFLTAPADIGSFVRDTLGTAVYNGVLGALLYLALRPLFRPKVVSLNE